jgi:hypothetical protein
MIRRLLRLIPSITKLARSRGRRPTINLLQRVQVYAKDGTVKSDTGFVQSHSFTKVFLNLVYGMTYVAAGGTGPSVSLHDTSDTERALVKVTPGGTPNYAGETTVMPLKSAENDDTYGIVIGTDNTTPTNDDYNLLAQVAHGSGSGEMLHGPHSVVAPYEDGQSIKYELSRTFNNQSGAAITLREIGMITRAHYGGYNSNTFALLLVARDVFSDVEVGDEETVQITYVFETSIDESA